MYQQNLLKYAWQLNDRTKERKANLDYSILFLWQKKLLLIIPGDAYNNYITNDIFEIIDRRKYSLNTRQNTVVVC